MLLEVDLSKEVLPVPHVLLSILPFKESIFFSYSDIMKILYLSVSCFHKIQEVKQSDAGDNGNQSGY